MRVTAVKPDRKINVDGKPLKVSRFPDHISDLRVLQWQNGNGHIEYGGSPNESISDFSLVEPFVDEWEAEKLRREQMPLDPARIRPTDLGSGDTIYRRDVDVTVLTDQMKTKSDAVKAAIENGNLTISIREPTKSLVGAVLFDVTNMELSLESMRRMLDELANEMGFRSDKVMVNMGTKQIEIPIEMYEQSAFVKQVEFRVGDLPD